MDAAVSEPFFALDPTPVDVGFGSPRRQRRVTVAFRGLLVLPHVLLLLVLMIVAIPLAVVGWFSALILGRLPQGIADYEMAVIAYATRVYAYGYMLVGEYPPFPYSGSDYPVRVEICATRLSRVKVFFRFVLMFPAAVVAGLARIGLLLFSPILWIATLALGQMPQTLFSAAAAVIRFEARFYAFGALVTDANPRKLFGDLDSDFAPEGAGRELRLELSRAAKGLVTLMLVLGIGGWLADRYVQFKAHEENLALVQAKFNWERANENWYVDGTFLDCNLTCREAHDRAFGEAFEKFASRLSRIPFPAPQRRPVSILIRHARKAGQVLIELSTVRTAATHDPLEEDVRQLVDAFAAEAGAVLGPGLEGVIR